MDSADKFRFFSPKATPLVNAWQGQWLGGIGLTAFAIFTWLPNSYQKMVDWPWIMGWQIGLLAIGIFGFWMLRQFQTPFKWLGHGLDGAVVAIALVIISSSAVAEFPQVAALNALICLFYVSALYVFHNWIAQSRLSHYLIWLWLCGVGSITSLVSLALWKPDPQMWLSDNFYAAIRNGLPLGHHNFVGGYLVLIFPILTAFAIAQTGWKRGLGLLMSTVSVVALYVTGSRGAWLGAIAIVLTTIVVSITLSRGQQRRKVLMGSLFALCLISIALFSNPRVRSMITIRSVSDSSPAHVVVSDGPAIDRWFMAQTTKNIVKENPLLGIGPGNLARVYNLYRPIEAGTGLELVQQMHNLPLQILSELGLIGFAAYVWFIVCFLRLWFKFAAANLQRADRYLLYGIGASCLGYSVSSLTDYQLENIGIASTLLMLALCVIALANREELDWKHDSGTFSVRLRRLLSLLLLGLMGIAIKFWVPMDVAMYFNHLAAANLVSGDIATADNNWAKSSVIADWDPVPSALAGQVIVDVIGSVSSQKEATLLNEQAISDYETALKEAPNDAWFNNNLAILYLPTDDKKSEFYASRAVQLAPRSQNNLYLTLGLAYLSQGKRQSAIHTFALEGLENSEFMSMDLWQQAPFDTIRAETIVQTTNYYQQLLTLIPASSSQYNQVYEQLALIRWWNHLDNPNIEMARMSPTLQAVLFAESQPDRALEIIASQIQAGTNSKAMKLLGARIAPQKYLDSYLSDNDVNDAEKALLQEHIEKQTSLQDWFKSVVVDAEVHSRLGLSFAYRNADANYIVSILQPGALNSSVIARILGLFQPMPREFVELDHLMETIRAKELGLQHPTQNHFQLIRSAELN